MTERSLYRYTSIARPLDPACPTNLAVLLLLPLVALAAAASSWFGVGALVEPGPAAVQAALVAFGTWALTRELAPDDNKAAFVSMALGLVALLGLGSKTVLPLYLCLFLVRVVNRTTGKAATPVDTLLVLSLALWAAGTLRQPLLPIAAAAAFALDAGLRPRAARQWIAAALALAIPAGVAAVRGMPQFAPVPVPVTDTVVLAVILLAYLASATRLESPVSVGDATGLPLSRPRVAAGMLVAVLVALQGFVTTQGSGRDFDVFIWACFAGVAVGRWRPRGGRS